MNEMLKLGQIVTYMKLEVKTSDSPIKIRVSTIYDPVLSSGIWETMVFNQRRKKSNFSNDWYDPIIEEHRARDGPQEQHEKVVESWKRRGYKVTRQHTDRILNDIAVLDLFGSSQEQWNQWKFLKYLKKEGRI